MIRIPEHSNWIEVDSAFGGFGIYKRHLLNHGRYEGLNQFGNPICEHVTFHRDLKLHGARLFVNPKLINTNKTDHSTRANLVSQVLRVTKYPIKILTRLL
jgi:hypothetical protein